MVYKQVICLKIVRVHMIVCIEQHCVGDEKILTTSERITKETFPYITCKVKVQKCVSHPFRTNTRFHHIVSHVCFLTWPWRRLCDIHK